MAKSLSNLLWSTPACFLIAQVNPSCRESWLLGACDN